MVSFLFTSIALLSGAAGIYIIIRWAMKEQHNINYKRKRKNWEPK